MADCVLIKRVVEWLYTQYDKSIPGYSACSIPQIQQGTTIHIDDLRLRRALNHCPLIQVSSASHFAYKPKHSGVHCKQDIDDLLQRSHAQYQVRNSDCIFTVALTLSVSHPLSYPTILIPSKSFTPAQSFRLHSAALSSSIVETIAG